MDRRLVLELPASQSNNPALWKLAGVPLLVRLIIEGARAGVDDFVVVGVGVNLNRARRAIEADSRMRGFRIWYQSAFAGDGVTVPANLHMGREPWSFVSVHTPMDLLLA